MRVLVTGGTGFIGAALVRELLEQGFSVRVLDDDSRGSSRRLTDVLSHVEVIHGDVRDPVAVASAINGCEAVAHLAFVNGTEFFYSRPEVVLDVGVKGTMNVIDEAARAGVSQFWFMSSSEVYQTPATIPTDETVALSIPDPLNPRYSYAGGKIIGELLTVNYGRAFFDRAVIVRPHNVYGPDMGREHVIAQFALRMRELDRTSPDEVVDFPIQGDGQQTRSFVHVRDFCRGALLAFSHGESPGIYHVGTQDERRIADIAELVAERFGRTIRLVPQPMPTGGTPRRQPDISKVRALGFVPHVSLEDGIAETVRWYRAVAD